MADLQSLANARFQLKLRRNETAEKLFARETARQALDAATRDFPADSQEVLNAQGAFLGAVGDVNAARDAEATARTTLNNEIRAWLTVPGTPNFLTPDADYARMALTDAPVALFPVRLETRFGVDTSTPPKPVLHVRVYPDEFLSDMHERELTPEERAEGEAYWTPPFPDGETEDVLRWTAMAQRFGVPRAAYIVRAMEPVSEAEFPPPRATSPSRAAEAVLPDRWVVLAFKNGELRKFKAGLPIPEPLTLTPDPSDDAPTFVEVADGFTVPTSVAWTVNYTEALNKGMAIDLDLAADEVTSGFDRVMVLGVKTSMAPNAVKTFLTELVDAHHYTRGIDLVPPGTATNNVPGFPTPFTMREPTGDESFAIERDGPNDGDIGNLDFYRLEDILGFVPGSGPFRFTREACLLRHQILDAERMRRILWASTLGYFMSQMMNPEATLFGDNQSYIFDDAAVASARAFFLKYVSAQGPAPAFRVGAVPYGVLPAIAVSRMAVKTGESVLAIDVMRRLLPYWRDAAAKVPKVPRNAPNPHIDLMKVISQKSRSDGVFVRNSLGVQAVTNIYQLALQDFAEFVSGLGKTAPPVVGSLGHPEWSAARIFGLTFLPFVSLHAGPLVTAHPKDGKLVSAIPPQPGAPDTAALNYLAFLGSDKLPLSTVIRQEFMQNAQPVGELTPLLYLMARHALLLEMVDITRRVMPEFLQQKGLQRIDLELFNISVNVPGPRNVSVMVDVLSAAPPGAPANQGISLFTAIRDNKKTGTGTVPFDPPVVPPDPNRPGDQYGNLQTNLVELAGLDVRELERLFMETLDLAAHRFDAFVTALATRRLLTHREASDINGNTYYGAYGFVEDVRPVARTTRQIPGLGNVDVQPKNGGFIHAPSLRHATAAAILRSGRMAEKSDPTKYAIELPSERARRAGDLLDGLRDGQALGALLGARLERALRERGQRDGINEMERYILALRTLYPQVANKSGNDPGLSADRIAARNVVDGKLVREAFNTPPGLPFGSGGLPGPSVPPGHAPAISQEVGRLNEIMDALGDLSMSEAIYQIAAGDVTTAEAAMNFLPQGNTPPEPEVTQTPTTGIAVNHRVALVLEPPTAGPVNGWNNGTPRAAVDPFVEDWAERQLGDSTMVKATLTYVPIHAPGAPPPPPVAKSFSIGELQIGALDFLALAQSTSVAGQRSPIDRMFETLLFEGTPEATSPVITYDTPAAGRSIPQLVELARALGSVLGASRELAPADLRRAEDGIDDDALQGTVEILLGTGQTVGQVQAAIDALEDVRDALAGSNPSQALRDASAYLADAFPAFDASVAELEAAAIGAQSELGRRVTDGQSTLDGAAASSTNAAKIAGAIQALRILFGRNTLAVMPAFALQGADEIRKSLMSLGRSLDLTDPDNPASFDAHQAPGRFLQQATRVHEQLGAWRRFTMYAGAFGAKAPLVSVAQLPFVEGEDWAGRSQPVASRTSLVLVSASGQTAAPNPATPWRGLLIDQWTEIVPSGKAETGIAFHYDSQNSEAPQVILMAMHSGKVDILGQPARWSLLELHSIVNETMDLARSRPVDNDMLALGQLDPPILVASNSQNNVVSTNLGPDARRGQPVIG